MPSLDSFHTRTQLSVGGRDIAYYGLDALDAATGGHVARLPFSMKILLENLLRHEDNLTVSADDIRALAHWQPGAVSEIDIAFLPARVLIQDFTGVPCIVDLAAMRDAIRE